MPDKLYHETCEAISQGRALLEDLQAWGFEAVPQVAEEDLPICSLPDPAHPEPKAPCRPETLEELQAGLADCQRCGLSAGRQNIVFGVGNPQADLVLVGEAPGREEDIKGYPFVGEAGRLLDKILFAMHLSRRDVYICNVIKCRPPSNRDPQPDEIAACEPFLKKQLASIKPRIIVALGRFAAQTLLQSKVPVGKLRGNWHEYQGIPLMPTFHPAYLLRNPAGKREVWEDMKQVMTKLRD
ncbi:DNA polymerase [Malonomonas rubra DSM 5091]|uniref:Type-4 uracil-DNA glycosylase n=1 Tax=Malonomonas rubra DSM 5091 TaxID=1122189 RepID=A0A1M6DIZ6_MALRU|nr:uracil-DNA glycosylase [Malonomonas rubra]SHI73140.1 DNA polymerase [Malonomonas rubra DSM 5091]